MERKITILILILFLLVSCKYDSSSHVEDNHLIINNKSLNQELISFKRQLERESITKQSVMRLYCFCVDDTTSQFVITVERKSQFNNTHPYHFIVKTKEYEVYVTDMTLIVPSLYGEKNFFINSDTIQKNNTNRTVFIESYTGNNIYLRYSRDKLIKKIIDKGSIYDHIKLRPNSYKEQKNWERFRKLLLSGKN